MARAQRKKTRDVEPEIREERISPFAAAFGVLAAGLSGLIIWNAFHGDHRAHSRAIAVVPKGASTHVEVMLPAVAAPGQVITIKYDAQVEDVQRELIATGHFKGLVDGVMGPLTEQAIRQYQRDAQMPETGAVSKPLLDQIRLRKKVAAASDYTGTIAKDQVLPVVASPKFGTADGIPIVREAQQRLRRLGYLKKPVSGVPDDATRASILEFQMDYGLNMDGTIGKELLSALKVAEAARSTVAAQ
jgi:peptidoglycan hydrolase-like protein with peptidoglycan-binding domain